jgi:hypothetical protein
MAPERLARGARAPNGLHRSTRRNSSARARRQWRAHASPGAKVRKCHDGACTPSRKGRHAHGELEAHGVCPGSPGVFLPDSVSRLPRCLFTGTVRVAPSRTRWILEISLVASYAPQARKDRTIFNCRNSPDAASHSRCPRWSSGSTKDLRAPPTGGVLCNCNNTMQRRLYCKQPGQLRCSLHCTCLLHPMLHP